MNLLPSKIKSQLPPLYSQEHIEDPIAQVKFFTPWTNWTWYPIEFDQEDIFFGKVIGHETEMGYFSLAELQAIQGPGGLRIERDLYFTPKPLSECR